MENETDANKLVQEFTINCNDLVFDGTIEENQSNETIDGVA